MGKNDGGALQEAQYVDSAFCARESLLAQAKHGTYGTAQSSSPKGAILPSIYVVWTSVIFAHFILCCIEQCKQVLIIRT